MTKIKLYILLILVFTGCNMGKTKLQTVERVDIAKYSGHWYEIGLYPNRFEKDCRCTTAEYKPLSDGTLTVVNKCVKNGKFNLIKGKAFVVPNSGNAKLKVQFFWPFKGDYWIIDLDEDYQWAVVSEPSKKYLWILSRKPILKDEIWDKIVKRLQEKGFDIQKIIKTEHDCK